MPSSDRKDESTPGHRSRRMLVSRDIAMGRRGPDAMGERPRIVIAGPGGPSDPGWRVLVDALHGVATVVQVGSVDDACREARYAEWVVLTLGARGAHTADLDIARLRRVAPRIRVAVRVPPHADLGQQLVRAVRAGTEALLLGVGSDVAAAARALVSGASPRTRGGHFPLVGLHDEVGRALVRIIERASDPPTVDELARWVNQSRRTLERQWKARGWPTPREMVSWGRLLAAAAASSAAGRSAEAWTGAGAAAAHRVAGFSSSAHMARTAHRLLGARRDPPATPGAQLPGVAAVLGALTARYPEVRASADQPDSGQGPSWQVGSVGMPGI